MAGDLNASVQSAMEALNGGGNPLDAAFADVREYSGAGGASADINEVSKIFDEEEGGVSEDGQPAGEEQPQEAATTPNETASKADKNPNIERIKVTGPNGPEEISIDFSDKESIKKAFSMSHGARKWQSERDSFAKRIKEMEPDYKDAVGTRDAIVGAFKQSGFKGLVNLLLQDEQGYQKLMDMEVEKRSTYRTATPELKARMDAEARYEELHQKMKYQEELNAREQEKLTRRQQELTAQEQSTTEASFNTMASTALQQHTFTGKLGDSELEARLNESVWQGVRKALNKLPNETEITQEFLNSLVEKEATLFGKGLGKKVNAEVQQKIQEKKQDSAVKLATAAAQGMGRSGAAEKFTEALNKGDTASAVRAFLSGGLRRR